MNYNSNNKVFDKLDKEWLDRVYYAYYYVYLKETPNSTEVEHFITWLYRIYGYVKPK